MKVNTKRMTAGIAAVLVTIFTLGAVPSSAFAGPPRHAKAHGYRHKKETHKRETRRINYIRPEYVRRDEARRREEARYRYDARRREEARRRDYARRRELEQQARNRQNTKNEWRNLSIAGGLVTAYGLLKHDNTITFLGAAGALYSLNRYEQDRKSQDKISRARAELFSRPSFVRDGRRYDRRLVTKNGARYYQFVRH